MQWLRQLFCSEDFRRFRAINFVLGVCIATGSRSTVAGTIEFNRDIRPILSDQCFSCHGPDANARKGDLRLDKRDEAVASGAIAPGKVSESELLRRIASTDPDEVMPPPDSHKKLSDAQRAMLQGWIEAGAEYQPHWAFLPPIKGELPSVRQGDWERNSVDRFILAKLEAMGLEPNSEADLNTLIRRVCLDLTGLPPTPAEIEMVLADPNPDRYERYVDRLLQRPTWGEHRARYWMDYARYGDTHGIHFDNYREMYTYRDWVIDAFNRNMPFDRFTVEQLAGDLLPQPTLAQKIATGFNRCNITTNEGGIIDEEYAVLYARDRVETTSTVWMGLTTGCAVCHDHKFDPMSQREFYQLAAFFNNTTQKVRDGNVRDTPPIVAVPLPEDSERYEVVVQDQARLREAMNQRRQEASADYQAWIKNPARMRASMLRIAAKQPRALIHLPLTHEDGTGLEVAYDGRLYRLPLEKEAAWTDGHVGPRSWLFSNVKPVLTPEEVWNHQQPFTLSFWLRPEGDRTTGQIAGVVAAEAKVQGWVVSTSVNRLSVEIVGDTAKELIKVTSEKSLTPKAWQHVTVTYDGKGKAEGMKMYVNAEPWRTKINNDVLKVSKPSQVAFHLGGREKGAVPEKLAIQEVRYFQKELTSQEVIDMPMMDRAALISQRDKRSPAEESELMDWYLVHLDEPYQDLNSKFVASEGERSEIEKRGTIAHVMAEKPEPPVAYVLMRGDYDKRGDEVKPATPAMLPAMPEHLPQNRLGLAEWLVRPEHPLTARVTVNRFWQEIFGQGLVASTGDFGMSGMPPTNQPLLDYLAVTFRESDWNVKELFRLIVTSATYRQSAVISPQKHSIDPLNAFCSRGPRFRLDGEMIRDYALYTSGLLSARIGGKSVRPYQPSGVWEAVAMPNSDTKSYQEDKGEALYRRSLYTFWKRAAPPASLEIFNAPTREVCVVKRERTNTPLQALVTLNDPQFLEAARHLGQRSLEQMDLGDIERLQWIAQTVLGRSLKGEETAVLQSGLEKLRAYYRSAPADAEALIRIGHSSRNTELDPSEHAAWSMIAHQLLNLDEALCK